MNDNLWKKVTSSIEAKEEMKLSFQEIMILLKDKRLEQFDQIKLEQVKMLIIENLKRFNSQEVERISCLRDLVNNYRTAAIKRLWEEVIVHSFKKVTPV